MTSWFDWVRERWMDCRFGLIYASVALSFTTFATVTYADISQVRSTFPDILQYVVLAVAVGTIGSTLLGYLHRKYQNPTDIRLANGPLFDQIRKIVREELDRDRA